MPPTDISLLYRIATSYYKDGRTQEEISRRENISRSQVSRLLDKARDVGVVKIEVSLPSALETDDMVAFIESQLGLERLILAPAQEEWDSARISESIAAVAATALPRILRGSTVIGIGWGKTIYRMASGLRYRPVPGEPLVVPLIGASGSDSPYLQINTIIDRMAEHLQGDSFFANLPAFREKNIPLTAYENKRLNMLHDYWNQVDAAVFGLGERESSRDFFDEEVSPDSRERIFRTEVVGEVLSQFFFADGSLLSPDESYHTNAFPVERLKNVPKTICLAGGWQKVEGILAGARAGFFNTLITDSNTALGLYEMLRKEVSA